MRSRLCLSILTVLSFVSLAQSASANSSSIQRRLTGSYVSVTADCEVILPGLGAFPAPVGTVMTVEAGDASVTIRVGNESVVLPVNPPPSGYAEIVEQGTYDDTSYNYSKSMTDRTGISFESLSLKKRFLNGLEVQSGLNNFSGYNYCKFK